MQNSFRTIPVKSVSSQLAPLAPLNLLRAGVPAREVVWFRRLRPASQMAALTTTRGKLLLDQVRAFVADRAAGAAPPTPA